MPNPEYDTHFDLFMTDEQKEKFLKRQQSLTDWFDKYAIDPEETND